MNARGGFWNCTCHGGLNAKLFVGHRTKSGHLVVDRLPTHKTTPVKAYVTPAHGMLTLHFLPGDAPELNPDELVWSRMKAKEMARALRRGETLHEKIGGF